MLRYIVFLVLAMSYGVCEEPKSCSQFYYVDKLLDKMIRMEVKVEGIDKEVTTTLKELKREREEFKNDIASTNTEVVSTLEELKREREEFKNDITELKTASPDDITNLINRVKTPTIVFKARTAEDQSPATGQTIIFKDTMLNYGNGYDNTTGIFTAPVNGTYLFTFHLCTNSNKYMNYGLVYNNILHTAGTFYDEIAVVCHTADGMLQLSAGHKVWIKCLMNTSSGNVLYEYTSTYNQWNTFSGMLIHK